MVTRALTGQIVTLAFTHPNRVRITKELDLLKSAIHRLTDSVRHLRKSRTSQGEVFFKTFNIQSDAKGAVASIFTIVNDFK